MKKLILVNFLLGSLLFGSQAFARTPFWTQLKGNHAPSAMEMIQQPSSYRILSLDNAAMKAYLENVSADYNQAALIDIPAPEGGYRTFKIWHTSVMAPELAAKYPEIITFTGEEVGKPHVTAKIGFNAFGFNAMVSDGPNTFFVDPYSNANDGYYMAFYKRNIPNPPVKCGNEEMLRATGIGDIDQREPSFEFGNNNNNPMGDFIYAHGAQQRKFRTAVTNTGEWGASITGTASPTKAQVLSKIVDIVNRINSYYEREIAVTLELVPNNDLVVYTDAGTDPYVNDRNMMLLLDESHSNLVNRLGGSTFDLGHILCTAGGGLAATPSVCSSNSKGRAASTLYNTTNVSTMMHEMGHQMSASHTFSANTAGCAGNGMPQGAYESGSGVTIMSYEGACGENNVFGGYDDYYHVNTLLEISNHINNNINCGTLTNNIPVLSIPNITDVYHIPSNTPFELVGKPATVQGSQIPQTFFYNWEQYDIGFDFTEANGSTQVVGPTMKSHFPKMELSQAYPPIDTILNSIYSTKGYRLPTVARDLHFKFTARGLLNGRGAFCTTDSVLTLKSVSSAGPFRVTSHNSGTSNWDPGNVVNITWNVANTNAAPINCNGVSIYLHFPDGSQPDILLVGYAPNTGSFQYTVQNVYARNGHLKIKGSGNVFFDMGKGKININGVSVDEVTFNDKIDVYPNPATDRITIKNDNSFTKLDVVLYNMMGQTLWQGSMDKELEIPTSKFARGNYVIQLIDPATQNVSNKKVALQ